MPDLLDKATALYYTPESIGSPDGARCDICWKFDAPGRSCVEVEGKINGPRGICGLYVNGAPVGDRVFPKPSRKVTQQEAGYSQRGPTHCGNCEYMIIRRVYGESPCKKVQGMVDGRGCCNSWDQ